MKIRLIAPEHAPLDLLLTADPSIAHIRGYLAEGLVFLGEEDHGPVAVAVLVVGGHEAELKNIAVAETHRGRGLGREMLLCVVDHAAKSGAARLVVGTGNSSLGELAFYQKCGFRIAGVIRGFFDGYEPPMVEDGIRCRDMVRLDLELG